MNAYKMINESGFSLLETLIAVLILSTVSMISLTMMSHFGDANQALSNQISHLRHIERAQKFIQDDMKNAIVRTSRLIEEGNASTLFTSEQASTDDLRRKRLMRFTRGSGAIASTDESFSPIETIEYWIENHTLTRRSFDRPDPSNATPYRDYVILENIDDLDIRFLNGSIWVDDWISTPQSVSGRLPRAVNFVWSMPDPNTGKILAYNSLFAVGVLK